MAGALSCPAVGAQPVGETLGSNISSFSAVVATMGMAVTVLSCSACLRREEGRHQHLKSFPQLSGKRRGRAQLITGAEGPRGAWHTYVFILQQQQATTAATTSTTSPAGEMRRRMSTFQRTTQLKQNVSTKRQKRFVHVHKVPSPAREEIWVLHPFSLRGIALGINFPQRQGGLLG